MYNKERHLQKFKDYLVKEGHANKEHLLLLKDKVTVEPTRFLILGYMKEYISSHSWWCRCEGESKQRYQDRISSVKSWLAAFYITKDINDCYDGLIDIIAILDQYVKFEK
jgi:hypothetical protein